MTFKFNDNFIYNVPENEKESIARLDEIDDTIWKALVGLNKFLEVGVDFGKIEHTPLSVEAREALIEVLDSFK